MRKHTVRTTRAAAALAVGVTLLAAACNRTSDTPAATNVGSAMSSTVAVDAGATPPSARMMAQAEPLVAARAERAATGDGRAVTLGTPLPMADPSGAMLIRNGQASIEVARLDDAVARVRQTATQLGGFVANTSIVGGKDEHRSGQLELRVPSAQFDAAVAALGSFGKVESVAATVQDAGDEYVDLAARAANARHMEARLVEMLAQRTGKLSEALTVEQELRRVREEIERYDARLNWLSRKASMSSLEITLHEPVSVLDQRGPSPIAEAFAEAWRRAVAVLAWCIASLGVLVPLAVLAGAIALVVRQVLRGRGAAFGGT